MDFCFNSCDSKWVSTCFGRCRSPWCNMILFDNQDMRVLYEKRDGSTLVISFPPRSIVAHGEEFWARGALGNAGVSAIGFMPKGSNWFAPAYMEEALASVVDITLLYEKIIIYGESAGAYAAIKWSRRLSAQYAICLGPQWTIDPSQLQQNDCRFSEYFTSEMTGMELTSQDLGGKVFIFYDPYHSEDTYNATVISGLSSSVEAIPCAYMDHSVIELFSGSQHVKDLLDACTSDAKSNLMYIAGRVRRKNKHRLLFMLARLSHRRPELAVYLCIKYASRFWNDDSYYVTLGDYIKTHGRKRLAAAIYAHALSHHNESIQLQQRVA